MDLKLPGEWQRVGRGHALEFYASDEEVARFVSLAQQDAAEHVLIGTSLLRGSNGYRPVAQRVTNFIDAVNAGLWTFYLAPEPTVRLIDEITPPEDVNAALSLTGFISVQHGARNRGKRVASCISVVSRVENVATGEEAQSATSLAQFQRLKRTIRKELRHSSVLIFPNGQRVVDSSRVLMTVEACALASTGFFDRECGPPV